MLSSSLLPNSLPTICNGVNFSCVLFLFLFFIGYKLEVFQTLIRVQSFSGQAGGLIGYYYKFWDGGMRGLRNQLNHRLLKWEKWEKGLDKYASLNWLRSQYKQNPGLFAHWILVQP